MKKSDLHQYQVDTILFVLRCEAAGLCLDMGLGKTIVILSAIAKMLRDGTVKRVLVIGPLNVILNVWQQEIAKWDHVRHLKSSRMTGPAAKRRAALAAPADIYLINAENTQWLVKEMGKKWDFDCLIVDESTLFKNPAAKRFRALKSILPRVTRRYTLSATPAPRNCHDLWSQTYLLDEGERLFPTVTRFRDRWFNQNRFTHQWVPRCGADQDIHAKVTDLMRSLAAKDYLEMPDLIKNNIYISLPPRSLKLYQEAMKELLIELNQNEFIDIPNTGALLMKLRQICNGFLYNHDRTGYTLLGEEKLDALEVVMEGSESVLVFYQFQADRSEIVKRFKYAEDLNERTIGRWQTGRVRMLIANAASAAHGLNLAAGGRIMVFYGMTYNLEHYLQCIGRLYRQGADLDKPVIVHHLIAADSIEPEIMAALDRKESGQQLLLNRIKARF